MKSLYMYFLGGTIRGANIEVHDVQFSAVEQPEQAFGRLARLWFGDQELLHVDVIRRINWIDGFDVTIKADPPKSEFAIYFVNMGGYIAGESFERHAFEVIAARSEVEAKGIAKKRFFADHLLGHRDFLLDIDGLLKLEQVNGDFVELTPNPDGAAEPPSFQGYKQIGGNRFA